LFENGKVPTRSTIFFDEDNRPRCHMRSELVMHVLRDCNEARDFW